MAGFGVFASFILLFKFFSKKYSSKFKNQLHIYQPFLSYKNLSSQRINLIFVAHSY
ncbi:hypothetical protein SAMN04489724_2934 [Algoriphagus locisalis]|uniref:Uncharacterized protein n=1 Tax=Algoriphagus locisalis TaxID=305507 RepID=A0A1I7C7F7_9BACT|nr:hypothetical protein SAMN04489724_2934 [Algoriphagus locisalis]